VVNLGNNKFKFTTKTPHGLTQDSKVILKKEFSVETQKIRYKQHKYTLPTQREFSVIVVDEYTFCIYFDNYILVNVRNYDIDNTGAILEFLNFFPYECVNDDNNFIIKSYGKEYNGAIGAKYGYTNGDINEDGILNSKDETILNVEDMSSTMVHLNKPLPYIVNEGSVFIKNTWHLKDDNLSFDDENIQIFENRYFIGSFITLSTDINYKVGDDNLIGEKFLSEVTNDIIPEIIDNEKRQFLPSMMKDSKLNVFRP
jgi:hypothetical protein